jgi:hypothetical protein
MPLGLKCKQLQLGALIVDMVVANLRKKLHPPRTINIGVIHHV